MHMQAIGCCTMLFHSVRHIMLLLLGLCCSEVWFVEEQDLLALALEGRYVKRVAPLTCPHGSALASS